jgi:cytochrome c553
MPAAEYAELADLDREGCARCHGENGEGGAGPRLDIQSPAYIAAALEACRQGTRASGTMIAAASRLSDDSRRNRGAGGAFRRARFDRLAMSSSSSAFCPTTNARP